MTRSKLIQRVGHRRFWSMIWSFLGLIIVGMLCYLAIQYILMEIAGMYQYRRLVLTVFGMLLLFAYLGGIAVHTIIMDNVDMMIYRMGPVERHVMKAQIEQIEREEEED